MSKESQLQGVAHNIMDHAVSGLGFLIPHVVDYCTASGRRRLLLNLLPPEPVSADADLPRALEAAAEACQAKFVHILTHAGFQIPDVFAAHLEFDVAGDKAAEAFTCECVVESQRGKRYVTAMNSDTYWLAKREDPLNALRKLRHGG